MSDLRHKTPEELRKEIAYQERMLGIHDASIAKMEAEIEKTEAYLAAARASLSKQKMTRNNHHQRHVWAKNYLLMADKGR